jgi:hypothetical protein
MLQEPLSVRPVLQGRISKLSPRALVQQRCESCDYTVDSQIILRIMHLLYCAQEPLPASLAQLRLVGSVST